MASKFLVEHTVDEHIGRKGQHISRIRNRKGQDFQVENAIKKRECNEFAKHERFTNKDEYFGHS